MSIAGKSENEAFGRNGRGSSRPPFEEEEGVSSSLSGKRDGSAGIDGIQGHGCISSLPLPKFLACFLFHLTDGETFPEKIEEASEFEG